MGAQGLPYRPCVGIALFDVRGRVWMGERSIAAMPVLGPHRWQMPQGGIDAGETPLEAARRELQEETGTDKASVLAEARAWFTYDLPDALIGRVLEGRYCGQRQKWFAMRFDGRDADFNLNATDAPEFERWAWRALDDAPSLVVPFKREVYDAVVREFAPVKDKILGGLGGQ